jgi:hypothetical protein
MSPPKLVRGQRLVRDVVLPALVFVAITGKLHQLDFMVFQLTLKFN